MDATQREPRVLWSFWIACGLAVTGGLLPLLLAAGGTNRIAGAVIPFGVAAIALAAAALLYPQGRPVATALYFVASMALVYGMLLMIAVPLRLAVLGTCNPAPAICPSGFEPPMSGGEDSGLAIGVAMGTLAILVGFFGLLMLFRIRTRTATPPPMRREKSWEPPAPPPSPSATTEVEPAAATVGPSPPESPAPISEAAAAGGASVLAKPPRKPRAKRTPKPPEELAAPAEPLELAAPKEPLELPAPSPSPDEKAEADSTS